MALFLLDRDGVVIVNRRDNIKNPADLELIAGVGPAIARLNQAGVTVARSAPTSPRSRAAS
jgi:D-glycero-D-manno-heptose 1,7-bisphosphate phosphatase